MDGAAGRPHSRPMPRYPETAGPIREAVPEGDNRPRLVCSECGFVLYRNPKVVVGTVSSHEGKILLCRRAIAPQRGFWTIPAGYLELGESAESGALREAREEAHAEVAIDTLLALYSIPRIGQVQLIYRARLLHPGIAPGHESLEARLFDWGEIPWHELAFPSVRWALDHWLEMKDVAAFAPRQNPEGANPDYIAGRGA